VLGDSDPENREDEDDCDPPKRPSDQYLSLSEMRNEKEILREKIISAASRKSRKVVEDVQ